MRKIFSNRRLRRIGATFLLGVQLSYTWYGGLVLASEVNDRPVPKEVQQNSESSAQTSQEVQQNSESSAQASQEVSTDTNTTAGISSGDVQSAAQSGAQVALEDGMEDLGNQVADQLSGGTGVTWGDIYASLNDVDSSLKSLDKYVQDKHITSKDYYATIVGMYLSQYTACMQGNLLNVVTGLEENLEDDDLNSYLMIGNAKKAIKLKTALEYIKSSYSVTPLYKGNEDKNLDGFASLRDLYEKDASGLYLKDTQMKVNSFEVTNTADGSAANTKVEGDIAQWLPALSYSARNSDSFKINNIDIESEDKSYCVFNSSSACRLALQFCYSELERYNEYDEDDYMWQEKEELLDQGLYMDNFGNIVALDVSNKQYTIVLNCLLNPTLMEIGSNESFNMSAYGVQSVYTDYNGTGKPQMGWYYDKDKDTYEYLVVSTKKTKEALEKKSPYVATKWISNILGSVSRDIKSDDSNYFAVFTFANDSQANKDSIYGAGSESIKKPANIGDVSETYGSIEMTYSWHTYDGQLLPMGGLCVSLKLGSEDISGKYIKSFDACGRGVSLAYLRTNHNRAEEAYYGYKNCAQQVGENVIQGGAGGLCGALGGSAKVGSSVRGNMGGYITMPIPTTCLYFGIGDTRLNKDSNKLKFDWSPLRDGEEEYDTDVIGYHKDYTSFYRSEGYYSGFHRFIGFLYTPKTISRGKSSHYAETRASNPTIKNVDADTILLHLRLCCKGGILRKANITDLGRQSSNGKKPKGMKGYHEATTKLIKEANSKVTDYIETGFDLKNDSPVNGVKYSNIWALGLDIYGEQNDLLEQCKRSVTVYDTCTGTKHNQKDYNTVEVFTAITKNTSSNKVRVTETGELSQEAKDALKEEKSTGILDRVYDMLCHPITTFMKLVSGFLQWVHTGLSNGNLASFFYITDKDVATWLQQLPYILILVTLAIFAVRMGFASLKFAVNKESTFKELTKNFTSSAVLVTIPIICLTTMRSGIGVISDKGMNDSVIKIESVYLNKQLNASVNVQKDAEETGNNATMYFIEHFQAKRTAEIGIDVLNTAQKVKKSTINPNEGKTSKFVYETFNIQNLPTVMDDIAEKNATASKPDTLYGQAYDGKKFRTVFHSYYEKSLFFYFLDYYLNEWCLLNGKVSYYYESDPSWATTMQTEMCASKDSFRNLYNKRAIIYGPSAGLASNEKCLDDIFGLGQLFYHDGKKASDRGYYLPIEIYDTQMKDIKTKKRDESKKTDSTQKNSKTDLWNGYKHGRFFMDESFKKTKLDDADTVDPDALGDCAYPMAYSMSALEARASAVNSKSSVKFKNQVIASEAVFEANGIDKNLATPLERALWEVNNDIYSDVIDYFDQSTGEVNDFTDAVMLAAISTFKFNDKFGTTLSVNDAIDFSNENGYVLKVTETIKPISFAKEKLDMDVIMKAIYAGDNEVKEEYDLMYYLGSNTFGVVAAIILIVAEVFMIAYVIVRMVHLLIMYCLATFVCTFQYSLKQNKGNKAWIGVLSQALYFLVAHGLMVFMMNMAVCNDLDRGGMTSVLLSLLLLLGSGFAMAIEIKVMIFLLKNFRDLGGAVVADKVNSAMANIQGAIKGRLNGDTRSNKVKMHADEVKSYGNDDDDEVRQNMGGNTELAEAVEQADKVRGEMAGQNELMLPELANGGALGDTYNIVENGDVITGGDTFGDTEFQSSGGMGGLGSVNFFDIDSYSSSMSASATSYSASQSFSASSFNESNSTFNDSSYSDNGDYSDYRDYSDYSDNSYLDDSYSSVDNSVIDSGNDNSTTINE